MCGIYGVVSTALSSKEKDDAHMLGLLNMPRGTDSAGILVARKNKGIKLTPKKTTGTAALLFASEDVEKLLDQQGIFMVLGHNRAATVGGISVDNAHPIWEGNITGVHNGTLGSLISDANKKDVSDSRLLFRMINEMGLEKALNELKKWDAYALVYTDLKERTLNFVRNDGRPLHIMFSKSKLTFWFSSELRALQFIAEGTSISEFQPPFLLPQETLMQMELGKMQPREVPLQIKQRETFLPTHRFGEKHSNKDKFPALHDWSPDDQEDFDAFIQRIDDKLVPSAAPQRPPAIIHVPPNQSELYRGGCYRGWEGVPLKIHDAKKLLEKGCAYCGYISEITGSVLWVGKKKYICPDCMSDPLCAEQYQDVDKWKGELSYESKRRV